jgi:hypothetical protein
MKIKYFYGEANEHQEETFLSPMNCGSFKTIFSPKSFKKDVFLNLG